MAITLYNINKWYKMLVGKSAMHVNQDIGKCFSNKEITGYYNNLTEKVTIEPQWLKTEEIVSVKQPDGKYVIFPVAVFQYALGCYDLYLSTKNDIYINKFLDYAQWTLVNQDEFGRWDNFSHTYPNAPYGAMAQGEAASVLIRAYIYTKKEEFIDAARKAIEYMLKSITEGGTSLYQSNDLLLKEYTHLPVVLNGWIFAWWGLYDYVVAINDTGLYKEKLDQSLHSLIKYLPKFKNSFWSKYDLSSKLTSPFYHNLHIAQMEAMYKLTGLQIFNNYAIMWRKQLNNPFIKSLAFIIKAVQKIKE